MRQTIQFVKENYGSFTFNCKQYHQLYELMKHDKEYRRVINFTLLKEVGDICPQPDGRQGDYLRNVRLFYRECMGV